MYLLLNLVNPKYIIDINWISKWQSLYKLWTLKHQNSKFIVIQHGSYAGGIVNDNLHKYTKCDVFLTWSDYFTTSFKKLNLGKRTKIITFGNPIYNKLRRNEYTYSNNNLGKILVVPAVIFEERLNFYIDLFDQLKNLGFDVYVKEHNFQGKKMKLGGKEIYFPKIESVDKIMGNLENILKNNDFDLIISDHSTALLDAIYFKNKVLYFAPDYFREEYVTNQYSAYLENLFYEYKNIEGKDELYKCISIGSQEKLFSNLIYEGDNELKNYL